MITNTIESGTLVSVTSKTCPGRQETGVVRKKNSKQRNTNGGFDVSAQASGDAISSGAVVYDVWYNIDKRLSLNVDESRINVAMLDTTARRRSPADALQPSLLSHVYQPTDRPLTQQAEEQGPRKNSYVYLIQAADKMHKGERLIIHCLKTQKGKVPAGWLGRMESGNDINLSKQLSVAEKKKAMDLILAAKPNDSAIPLVAYAWGKSAQALRDIYKKMLKNPDASVERKKRKDAGQTLINSEDKRKSVFTRKFVFTKQLKSQNIESAMTKEQVDAAWKLADKATKVACARTARCWLQQGPFILAEIKKALELTNGSASWALLATLVSGSGNLEMISKNTIRDFVLELPGTTYTSTRILPKLCTSNKENRLLWAQQFWIFWESAVYFNGVQILLVHMDEKWFWSIVVRRNLKCVPFLGIEPVQHDVQHKSHLDKVMGIASTAFEPAGNDMSKGGKAHLVNMTRVGRLATTTRNTYKRVYKGNKGDLYFKSLEVTGSNAGTRAEPKFDLLSHYANTEIPKLGLMCQEIGTRTGKRVVVRYQKDNAGPHKDKKLVDYLTEQFDARGWMLAFQPSNSPICNTNDDCFFPALSRHISRMQGVTNGSRIFQPDELWAAVEKCFNEFPLDTLARLYVRHAQIVSAIASCNGGDEFVRERNGLHFNVRNCCVTECSSNGTPMGVEVVESIEQNESGREEKLQYDKPTFSDDNMLQEIVGKMTPGEIRALYHGLPSSNPMFENVLDAFAAVEGVSVVDATTSSP